MSVTLRNMMLQANVASVDGRWELMREALDLHTRFRELGEDWTHGDTTMVEVLEQMVQDLLQSQHVVKTQLSAALDENKRLKTNMRFVNAQLRSITNRLSSNQEDSSVR